MKLQLQPKSGRVEPRRLISTDTIGQGHRPERSTSIAMEMFYSGQKNYKEEPSPEPMVSLKWELNCSISNFAQI